VNTWIITAVDPDQLAEGSAERGTVATLHGVTRGEALARGCEAIVDGFLDVWVESTFRTYSLVGA
jgi:hypothetical protein